MLKDWIFLVPCLLPSFLCAQNSQQQAIQLVPTKEIDQELDQAQKDFNEAKKMFNPWYTGPLLAPSAHVLPPPHVAVQPYFFYTNNYAQYDEKGHSHRIPHLKVLKPSLSPLLVGITKWMDAALSVQGIRNIQSGHSYMDWGDTSLSLGFGLLSEKPYIPALKLVFKEVFPTGNYENFSPKKANIESTGGGSFQTAVSLNISKVIWWLTTHPMSARLSLSYVMPANVDVKGFNTYGGDLDTRGTVSPGNNFSADFGCEYSFTKRWVAAMDVVYSHSWKTTFSGRGQSSVGGPFSDQVSLAPALEYNINGNLGFLAGVWFPVWGRNSLKFFSQIVSVTYTF